MRGFIESARVVKAAPLNSTSGGGRTTFSKELPIGEGIYQINLQFRLSLTVGTAATTRADSLLRYIQNIGLRTSAGETICDLPGAALWDIAKIKSGTNPAVFNDGAPNTVLDPQTMPATTGVYVVDIPIMLVDWDSKRLEDTVLDTSRYSSITLDVTTGGFTDLFAVPGTMTMDNTLDIEFIRSKGPLPSTGGFANMGGKPIKHISYQYRQPVDAFTTTVIDFERSVDLWIRRAYISAVTGGTAVAWAGPAAVKSSTVLNDVSIEDQSGFVVRDRRFSQIRAQNKREASLEGMISGVIFFDFMADKSLNSAIYTGNKSTLQLKYSTIGGISAGSFITLVTESHRDLR